MSSMPTPFDSACDVLNGDGIRLRTGDAREALCTRRTDARGVWTAGGKCPLDVVGGLVHGPRAGGHDEGPGSAWCGSRPFGRSDLDGQAGTTSKVRVAATSGCRRTVAS